jgi:hypothetical protein
MAEDNDPMADFWALEEAQCAQAAVERMRMDALANAIDALEERISDCEQLIAEGKSDYQRAFQEMIKPQVERIVQAKNRVLDTGSLPSVIMAALK